MDNKELVISLINDSLEIINKMEELSDNERDFIKKYSEHLVTLKDKIVSDKINMDEKHAMTGLFRWLGEYDGIVNKYNKLYESIYELELIFTKRQRKI